MSTQHIVFAALALLLAAPAKAADCSAATRDQLDRYTQRLAAVRLDKPGVARAYAADGTPFTGAEVLWMQGQLRALEHACSRSDEAQAQQRLAGLRPLLEPR
jgi:hypothetical protein